MEDAAGRQIMLSERGIPVIICNSYSYPPTIKYQNIVIKYETESSSTGSGQHEQVFSYSVDSALTFTTAGLPMAFDSAGLTWGKVVLDLSSIPAVNNNSKLVFIPRSDLDKFPGDPAAVLMHKGQHLAAGNWSGARTRTSPSFVISTAIVFLRERMMSNSICDWLRRIGKNCNYR